ncbi:MAG: chemotaxis protein CheW [Gammaproteobacteria bacterium]|nr:chemotaxis protein CheW [Gammaproteobacteria bacterium]
MGQQQALLEFRIGEERYGLPADVVDRVVNMVSITPLPGAPDVVSGVIDVAGELVPAISMRKRLGRPEMAISPDSYLCLARTKQRPVALIVDAVSGVSGYRDEDLTPAGEIFPQLKHVRGIARLGDGLVLVNDLDAFLSLEEQSQLDAAMKKPRGTKTGKC